MKSVPPFGIRGSARCAIRRNDQTETSIVVWKPARGHVGHPAAQGLLGREGDRVDDEVERAPVGRDPVEHRLELALGHHVHRHEDRRLDLARQRLDVRLRLVVEVGDRELGAERAEGAGAAPGDRAVVGDADDQAPAALEQLRLRGGKGHRHSPVVRRRPAPGCDGRSSAPRRSGRRGARRGWTAWRCGPRRPC